MVDTVVLKDSAAIDFFNNEMALVKINAEEDTVTAAEYNIYGYPTMVMLGSDGKEIDRLIGYLPPEPLIRKFRDYAKGIGTLDDLLNKATTQTNRNLYMQIGMKYKFRGDFDDAEYWYNKAIELGEPLDSLSGECRLALADMSRRGKDYDRAIEEYNKIVRDFGSRYAGIQAEIWIAVTYRKMEDTARALAQFKKFVEKYPDHEDAGYCRDQIARLTASSQKK